MVGTRVATRVGTLVGPQTSSSSDDEGGVVGPPNKGLVIFGQSNGLGHMSAAGVTVYAGLTVAFPAVQLQDHNAGSFSDPPTWHDEGPRDMLARTQAYNGYLSGDGGVELIVGRELTSNTAFKWYVAKMCVDGSSLLTGWNSPTYPTAGPSLLTQFVTYVQAWMAQYGITASNLHLLWIQGEADTGTTYALYQSNLTAMITSLRASLGNFKLGIHRVTSKNDVASNVRAAQEAVASADPVGCFVSYGDDLPLRDAAHYTDDGYANLANLRIAPKLIAQANGTAATLPEYRGTGPFVVASSVQALTPVLPPHQANDVFLMVLSGIGQNNYALTDAQGFAEITGSPQHNAASGANARIQVWWKRAASSAENSPTIGDAASDDAKICTVIVVRGCNPTGNPWDVTAGGTATTSTSVSCPTVTTTVANALVFAFCATHTDIATPQFSAWTNAALAEFTDQINISNTTGGGVTLGCASGRKVVAGATGATTATLATTNDQALLTIALRP